MPNNNVEWATCVVTLEGIETKEWAIEGMSGIPATGFHQGKPSRTPGGCFLPGGTVSLPEDAATALNTKVDNGQGTFPKMTVTLIKQGNDGKAVKTGTVELEDVTFSVNELAASTGGGMGYMGGFGPMSAPGLVHVSFNAQEAHFKKGDAVIWETPKAGKN